MKHRMQTNFESFIVHLSFLIIIVFLSSTIQAHDKGGSASDSDNKLMKQYIESKGSNTIVFDSSNIKQFWVDNSVASQNDSIMIGLNKTGNNSYESIPLKIQLANVNETLDCNLECISENSDLSFAVFNSKNQKISNSEKEDGFLNYSINASSFHMEDALSNVFYIRFSSKKQSSINLKKVILFFSNNLHGSFLSSPGTLKLTAEQFGNKIKKIDDRSFSVSGKRTELISTKKIYITNNHLQSSIRIKNIGDCPTMVYWGYAPYTQDHQRIHARNNPYGTNKVLRVVESEKDSDTIMVDAYPEWTKGCVLALNAKEDLSDFPNFTFVESTIASVKKIDDGHTAITFKEPLKTAIKKGTCVRVQAPIGDTYLYSNHRELQPGEEVSFHDLMQKDEKLYRFSTRAFCNNTYYVIPIVLSYSTDPTQVNSILISDYTISY